MNKDELRKLFEGESGVPSGVIWNEEKGFYAFKSHPNLLCQFNDHWQTFQTAYEYGLNARADAVEGAEPVGSVFAVDGRNFIDMDDATLDSLPEGAKLYTHPPAPTVDNLVDNLVPEGWSITDGDEPGSYIVSHPMHGLIVTADSHPHIAAVILHQLCRDLLNANHIVDANKKPVQALQLIKAIEGLGRIAEIAMNLLQHGDIKDAGHFPDAGKMNDAQKELG